MRHREHPGFQTNAVITVRKSIPHPVNRPAHGFFERQRMNQALKDAYPRKQ